MASQFSAPNNLTNFNNDLTDEWAMLLTGRTTDLAFSPERTWKRLSGRDWGQVTQWNACRSPRVGELQMGKRRGRLKHRLMHLKAVGLIPPHPSLRVHRTNGVPLTFCHGWCPFEMVAMAWTVRSIPPVPQLHWFNTLASR